MELCKKNDAVKTIEWYGKRWTELNALHNVWFYMQYGLEYGTKNEKSEHLENMYKCAKMFFTISRISLERTSRIEFVKLFEGNKNATIIYLREYMDKNAGNIFEDSDKIISLKEINCQYQKDIEQYTTTINAMKKIRNKDLAHNDLGVVSSSNGVTNLYEENNILIDDIFRVIIRVGKYITDLSKLLNMEDVCKTYTEMMDIVSLEKYFSGSLYASDNYIT